MPTLIQIWKVSVSASDWTPICCPVGGNCPKAWFNYDGDLHLRSDPNDPNTDYLCALAKGDQFDLLFTNPIAMDGVRPLVYLGDLCPVLT